MADIIAIENEELTSGSATSQTATPVLQTRFVDQLDGTWAEKVVVSAVTALPVTVSNTPNIGTVATLAGGQTAHSAASTGSPVRVSGRVQTAVDTTLIAGDASDLFITTGGAQIIKQYAIPEADWTYAAAAGGITNTTTAVTIKAAAAAGVRNYVTSLHLFSTALGAATEIAIRDGAAGTVLWRGFISASGLIGGLNITFPTPLKGTAATLLEFVTLTASVTGAVYADVQGYIAP